MARRRGFRIPGVSFSWKRATGVTAMKQRIARATGIPTTRAGRQRKVGKATGCALPLAIGAGLVLTALAIAAG